MTAFVIFLIPILSAVLVTPLSWNVLHSFYGAESTELQQIQNPMQRKALKALHGFFTWFALWMLTTLVLAAVTSALGFLVVPLFLGLAVALALFPPKQPAFWTTLVIGTVLGGLLMLLLQSLTGLSLSAQDYSIVSQLLNPYYLNPFFLVSVGLAVFITLGAASRRSASQPENEEHLLPPSLPDPTPPPR